MMRNDDSTMKASYSALLAEIVADPARRQTILSMGAKKRLAHEGASMQLRASRATVPGSTQAGLFALC